MQSILYLSLILVSLPLFGASVSADLKKLPFNEASVREDFLKILNGTTLESKIDVKFENGSGSNVRLECKPHPILIVSSIEEEKTSTLYKGIREIGFLFPHPLRQITPSIASIKSFCGKSWNWRPALKYRGFHLHTLHPSEWIAGFYQNRPDVAEKTIRWMARNQQNIFDLSLVTFPLSEISRQMGPTFELARKLQIHTGVSLGIALNQQNSFKLLSLWDSYIAWDSDKKIETGLQALLKTLPLSYVVLEAGSSEFTPTDFDKTLRWLNISAKILNEHRVAHFTKVHVSSNQVSDKWGNYNFLPQYAEKNVGVLPHTVMFYGLEEESAPMYGNKNFHGIRDFQNKEKEKRPTWYYPETSYWVAMDVDVPLLLTDYLSTRTDDVKYLYEQGIEGQLNFTTGHALGYWLFDWNLTLVIDLDYQFDPMIGLKLLGEDLKSWQEITKYQKDWYKGKNLISMLSAANLQDEFSKTHRIHDRFTMKDLSKNPEELKKEIKLLGESLLHYPQVVSIHDSELKSLFEVNRLRHLHALAIREALLHPAKKSEHLKLAADYREKAKAIIVSLQSLPTNYPDLPIFKEWKNETAYQFGYVYPAATLYFWEREERQIKEDSYFPLWGNIYDFIDIVF